MADKCPKCLSTRKFREVSKFLTRMILSRSNPGSKKSSSEITRMKIFATKDKAKPQQGECKGLNLVAVRLVEFQLTRLSVRQNRGQRAMAAVKAVMCAMHIALNTFITV